MQMTSPNQLLIAEATEYVFKSIVEASKPRSCPKTVSAFANAMLNGDDVGTESNVEKVVGVIAKEPQIT